jgi:asparagine N-glycosylation enzyme membrane subunit Stt3
MWRANALTSASVGYSSATRLHDGDKAVFLTSEFLVFVLLLLGLAIAASTSDNIDDRFFWIAATVASSVYMLSRGVAKAGSRSHARDPRDEIDLGRDD